MALKEPDFYEGVYDKVKISIMRLQHNEPPEGYYLAFSGGKDSIVIKRLAEMAGVKFEAHYNNTTIEPPDLVYYIRKHHSDVIIHNPKIPLLKLLETKGFPLRQTRWCCALYKEGGGAGRVVITGVRWAESFKRSQRKSVEVCAKDKMKIYVHPIIDWTDDEVWEFIKQEKLPYCKLYDEGWKRIGCLFCPMSSAKTKKIEVEKYPAYTRAFMRAFEKLYENRKLAKNKSVDRWANGKEMFEWWITGKGDDTNPDQTILFE